MLCSGHFAQRTLRVAQKGLGKTFNVAIPFGLGGGDPLLCVVNCGRLLTQLVVEERQIGKGDGALVDLAQFGLQVKRLPSIANRTPIIPQIGSGDAEVAQHGNFMLLRAAIPIDRQRFPIGSLGRAIIAQGIIDGAKMEQMIGNAQGQI